MNVSQDPFDVVAALRPHTSIDAMWPAEQREACHDEVLTRAGVGSAAVDRPSSLPRRAVLVLIAGLSIAGAGVGAAAAAGRLPDAFTRHFSSWKQDVGVDPQTAVRVASVPGPDGTVFTVWTARGSNGYVCVASGFELAHRAQAATPSGFDANGASCEPPGRQHPFGEDMGITANEKVHTYQVGAGTTARAEVRLADGTVLPAARAQGYYLGWYPSTRTAQAPQLIAYNSAGKPAGRVSLRYLR